MVQSFPNHDGSLSIDGPIIQHIGHFTAPDDYIDPETPPDAQDAADILANHLNEKLISELGMCFAGVLENGDILLETFPNNTDDGEGTTFRLKVTKFRPKKEADPKP